MHPQTETRQDPRKVICCSCHSLARWWTQHTHCTPPLPTPPYLPTLYHYDMWCGVVGWGGVGWGGVVCFCVVLCSVGCACTYGCVVITVLLDTLFDGSGDSGCFMEGEGHCGGPRLQLGLCDAREQL